jgi:hypothetical protein
LKFEVHSFFGSLNVYVKERANTFQFASLGRKADSLLSAQLRPLAILGNQSIATTYAKQPCQF